MKCTGRRIAICLALAGALSSSSALAQAAAAVPAGLPVYDVAAIKPNRSGSGRVSVHINDNLYSASNVSLKNLLAGAYVVREDLISGVEGPVASAHFDIEAKVIDPDPEAMKKLDGSKYGAMMIPILVDRFKLKAHTETKILPVYRLVVVKSGAKFKPAEGGDAKNKGTSINNRVLEAHSITMASLAKTLADQVHRPVIDKTGLPAEYDLNLRWSRDDGAKLDDGSTDTAPSIFVALPEQLGLRLEPDKGPVETLVVDHAEMPSEN